MRDLRIIFDNIKNLSLPQLKSLILGERDIISKNFILKQYRSSRYATVKGNLAFAYSLYYASALWKECVRPLLIAYGINSGRYRKHSEGLYECICGNIIPYEKLVPHHTSYPPLARKYKYKGFDGRIKLNHPERILFICDKCHNKLHRGN